VSAALVVRGRAKPAGWRRFKFDALQETVEGEVEIEPGLLAVRDDVETGFHLVVQGGDHGVINHFLAVGLTELVEVTAGELEPARERVAADHGRAQGLRLHRLAQRLTGFGGMASREFELQAL
jgi:hypothetical protein